MRKKNKNNKPILQSQVQLSTGILTNLSGKVPGGKIKVGSSAEAGTFLDSNEAVVFFQIDFLFRVSSNHLW